MKLSSAVNDSSTNSAKLKNFDLTVEEIRILKAIKDMRHTLEDMQRKNSSPERLEYFRCEIRQLEDQLEEIRENTLIR